jgi:hypothetical protein
LLYGWGNWGSKEGSCSGHSVSLSKETGVSSWAFLLPVLTSGYSVSPWWFSLSPSDGERESLSGIVKAMLTQKFIGESQCPRTHLKSASSSSEKGRLNFLLKHTHHAFTRAKNWSSLIIYIKDDYGRITWVSSF